MDKNKVQNDSLKNKVIKLSDFQNPVEEGQNRFIILDAEYDTIVTKKGETEEVIRFHIELSDPNNSTRKLELSRYLMFINLTADSEFFKFVHSALTATRSEVLSLPALIGLKGIVGLSYYRPEGSEQTFPRLYKWIFDIPNERVSEALANYLDADDDSEF